MRTWTGLLLIFLLAFQIYAGYSLTGKVPSPDYGTIYFLHTKGSWLLIVLFLTHATVNLRFLFRRWWPTREEFLVKALVGVYVISLSVVTYLSIFYNG